MSETVAVKSFAPGRDWSSEDGKINLTFYECVFDRQGKDFRATWNKKQGTGDPPIGESIEGEFTEKKPGDWRFRKASKPGGGPGGSNGGKAWQPEGERDPEKVARITRAHSQNLAVEVLNAVPSFAEAPKPNKRQAIEEWASFFDKDIQKAAAVAIAKDQLQAKETPPIRAAAADGELVDEESIPF